MTRTIRVIFARTFGRLWSSPMTAFSVAGFLALAGAFFTRALAHGDGGTTPVEALWAAAAVPFLPVLAALLTPVAALVYTPSAVPSMVSSSSIILLMAEFDLTITLQVLISACAFIWFPEE